MLLDILVTTDENFVITADRDEKIRVSKFPNSYNIVSYCLGHKKFVNNVAEVPHDQEILISCGGDGSFIFWDYKIGKEIHNFRFKETLQENDVETLQKLLKDCNVDESVIDLPVKQMQISKLNNETSIIVISFFYCKKVFIYSLKGKKNSKLTIKLLQSIDIEKEPLECLLNENRVWILSNEKLVVYGLKDNSFSEDIEMMQKLDKLNELWKLFRSNVSDKTLFPILYKRKFDNVKEYRERKRSRLVEKQSNE